jgi:hypothetical protein
MNGLCPTKQVTQPELERVGAALVQNPQSLVAGAPSCSYSNDRHARLSSTMDDGVLIETILRGTSHTRASKLRKHASAETIAQLVTDEIANRGYSSKRSSRRCSKLLKLGAL